MKTREGFVSNSSSSSFVVLIPENYTLTMMDEHINLYIEEKELQSEDHDAIVKKIKDCISDLRENKASMVMAEDDDEFFSLMENVLQDYIIGQVSCDNGEGVIVHAATQKVLDIVSKEYII